MASYKWMDNIFFNPITLIVAKEMLTSLMGWYGIIEVYCEDFEPLNKMAWKPTREIRALLFDSCK